MNDVSIVPLGRSPLPNEANGLDMLATLPLVLQHGT